MYLSLFTKYGRQLNRKKPQKKIRRCCYCYIIIINGAISWLRSSHVTQNITNVTSSIQYIIIRLLVNNAF